MLLFNGYFKQTVYESSAEYYRVRPVKIYYYLEDDTISVMEPPVENRSSDFYAVLTRDESLEKHIIFYQNLIDL